jgi:hypothetical protein
MQLAKGSIATSLVHVATPAAEHVYCVACQWSPADAVAASDANNGHSAPSKAHSPEALLEKRRQHYRSDWHRVNLKRRTAQLPPLSEAEFTERCRNWESGGETVQMDFGGLEDENTSSSEEPWSSYSVKVPVGSALPEDALFSAARFARSSAVNGERQPSSRRVACIWCLKEFSSEKALQQHERTARHREKLRELGIPESDEQHQHQKQQQQQLISGASKETSLETADLDAWLAERMQEARPLDIHECLFCNHKVAVDENVSEQERSGALLANLRHMAKEHSFFVPYIEYCYDLAGLVRYLGVKVGLGYCCVFGGRVVPLSQDTTDSAEQLFERRAEVFSSLQACRNHMRDAGHCRLPDFDQEEVWDEYQEFYSFTPVRADALLSSAADASEALSPGTPHEAAGEAEFVALAPWEKWVSVAEAPRSTHPPDEEVVGLQLGASGRTIAHRSLWRYYRQRVHDHHRTQLPVCIARQERQQMVLAYQELAHTAAIGFTGPAASQPYPSIPPRRVLERWRRDQLALAERNAATRRGRAARSSIAVLNSGYRG